MQASVLPHWLSEVQPATQKRSLQMYPELQSSLLLQRGRQVPLTHTSLERQFSLEEEQVTEHWPPIHLNPGPHWPLVLHSLMGLLQARRGSPVRPGGQEHWAWWFTTAHTALLPQLATPELQGSVHWLLMQAWSWGQVEEDLQPNTQVTPRQISWLLQSSSTRHIALHRPLSQTSFLPQFLSLKQTSLQNLPSQTCLSGHWALLEQICGCLTQATMEVGLGM
jgi:hypothetical protein